MSVPDRLTAALEGRYRIERKLGQGGMATEDLAADLKHDRRAGVNLDLDVLVGRDSYWA